MIGFIRKLINDRRGNALVIAAAAMPLIIAAAGLATDTIEWTLWKRQLQRAADSAAMAGVYSRLKSDTQSAVDTGVDKDLAFNLHTSGIDLLNDPTVELLDDDGDFADQVKVTLQLQQRLPFSSFFMSSPPVIQAVATAASVPAGGTYCVKALDPSATAVGIEITGNTNLDFGDCSLIANSTNPKNAASNGNNGSGGAASMIIAHALAAAGKVSYSGQWDVDHYYNGATPVADDYKDLAKYIPTSTSSSASPKCDKVENNTLTGATVDRTKGTNADTDPTKIICITNTKSGKATGVTVSGDMKLGKGTYVINGGDLTMNSTGSSLSCDGCTIVMTNFSDATKTGSVKLTGGTLNIIAPKDTGSHFDDIAFYQNPNAKDDGKTGTNQINGNSSGGVSGVVYFGNQSLLWNGGGNATAICLEMVVKRISFSGNSKFKAIGECGYGDDDDDANRVVRLVG
jgi:Flp pilus assembly protein TadG